MTDVYNINEKRVFLTGGSGGIGTAIRKAFEVAGCIVIAPELKELDLTNPESIRNCGKTYEKTDIFIHCAGLNILAGIDEVNTDILYPVFDVNLHSSILLLQSFANNMKKKGWGRVLFVSSLYGMVSRERRIAYSTSKTALSGLARTLTLELAKYGILTNCVAPGYVMTEMTRNNLNDNEIREIEEKLPTRRFQTPEEIASLILFLCSNLNQSISGQTIAVDGGFLCQ